MTRKKCWGSLLKDISIFIFLFLLDGPSEWSNYNLTAAILQCSLIWSLPFGKDRISNIVSRHAINKITYYILFFVVAMFEFVSFAKNSSQTKNRKKNRKKKAITTANSPKLYHILNKTSSSEMKKLNKWRN